MLPSIARPAPEAATERRADLVPALLRDVGVPFLLTRLLLAFVTLTAPLWLFFVPEWAVKVNNRFLSPTQHIGGRALGRWFNWDAAWYLRIAGNGPQMGYSHYYQDAYHHFSAFAFFPLYPLAVRIAALAMPGALAAVPSGGATRPQLLVVALIVSNIAFVLALLALYALVKARAGRDAGRRAVWLLCLFPTTVFFSAPYSESLFFLWVVLFFLALDRRRWWVAGLCGALASATRSLGVGLIVPYLVCYWQASRQKAVDSRQYAEGSRQHAAGRIRQLATGYWLPVARLWPVLLIPLGVVAYMVYLKIAWGDPLLFQQAEKAWQRSLAAPWVGIVDGLTWSVATWPHLSQPDWRGLTDALYAVLFLGLTALAWRDLGWVERAYAVVFWLYVLCEPQISDPRYPDTLISMARFLLVLLPLWLWLARSRRRTLLMAVPSAVVFVIYAARWVNKGWIG